MKVTLSAYTRGANGESPEVIAAASARVSRSGEPIDALIGIAEADVAEAQALNERVVFGFGHKSIAEHVSMQFQISGLSRLAAYELQDHRLASFTERSQRYVDVGRAGYVSGYMPPEEHAICDRLLAEYRRLVTEGMPPEDARGALPMAAKTQMVMSVNASQLGHMLSGMAVHPMEEIRDLGDALLAEARQVAPSLVSRREASRGYRDCSVLPGGPPGSRAPTVRMVHSGDPGVKGWRHDEFVVFSVTYTSNAYTGAQLQRHRMLSRVRTGTWIDPCYDGPGHEIMGDLPPDLVGRHPYCVPMGALITRTRMLVNLRELRHLCRLRCASSTQGPARAIAMRIAEGVEREMGRAWLAG